jgi:hypothetical protein
MQRRSTTLASSSQTPVTASDNVAQPDTLEPKVQDEGMQPHEEGKKEDGSETGQKVSSPGTTPELQGITTAAAGTTLTSLAAGSNNDETPQAQTTISCQDEKPEVNGPHIEDGDMQRAERGEHDVKNAVKVANVHVDDGKPITTGVDKQKGSDSTPTEPVVTCTPDDEAEIGAQKETAQKDTAPLHENLVNVRDPTKPAHGASTSRGLPSRGEAGKPNDDTEDGQDLFGDNGAEEGTSGSDHDTNGTSRSRSTLTQVWEEKEEKTPSGQEKAADTNQNMHESKNVLQVSADIIRIKVSISKTNLNHLPRQC